MSWYRKVDCQVYGDEKYRRLSRPEKPSGREIWIYLLTRPGYEIPGIQACGVFTLAEEMGFESLPEGFREAFREVIAEGLAEYDADARVILLPKAFKHNFPQSPNVLKGWVKFYERIPDSPLKLKWLMILKAFTDGLSKAFQEAFTKAFGKALPKGIPNYSDSDSDSDSDKEREKSGAPAPDLSPEDPPEALKLATWIHDKLKRRSPQGPGLFIPNIADGLSVIKAETRYSWKQINTVIKWAMGVEFWTVPMRSLQKPAKRRQLPEMFESMREQMRAGDSRTRGQKEDQELRQREQSRSQSDSKGDFTRPGQINVLGKVADGAG
ncbi:MAG: hypothetical protein GY835_05605 [bacterium]|nr:hypothetical protein [bacterium]